MKKVLLILGSVFCFSSTYAQSSQSKVSVMDSTKPVLVVEAACGECKFGLKGKGCNLAIRTQGKAYFVDGTRIDDHGDAHADDGFCEKIRQAEVQGRIVGDRFKVSYFKLLPEKK